MKIIISTLIAVASLQVLCATDLSYPSFKDLWDAADVVLEAKILEVEPHANQGDLPNGRNWGLEYTRVTILFGIDGFVKGSFNKMDKKLRKALKDEYPGLEPDITLDFYTAEKVNETVDDFMPPSPYLDFRPRGKYLVFLRRDVFGKLVPVNDYLFLNIVENGFKTQ